MKNILNFIDQWGGRISVLLLIIIFFKTCTTNIKIERAEKSLSNQLSDIDSTINVINQKIITYEEMIKIVKETPFWKSLELEELSDKNKIPINKLKNEYEVN